MLALHQQALFCFPRKFRLMAHIDNRILNLFVLKDLETLVLMFIKTDDKLYFKFFNYNLEAKGDEMWIADVTNFNGDGLFFKSVELPGNKRAFSLYKDGNGAYLYFIIYEFFKNGDTYSKTEIISTQTDGSYWFSSVITFNDLYKINDKRLAVATVSTDTKGLVLLLYDLYNNYQNVKTRWYYFNIEGISLTKELSIYSFNDYLMLTMTGGYYFADLVIFGYANGTDSIINISPYLKDSYDYSSSLNIITELYSKISIDNNVFGYVQIEKIKIVSIPEGIKFYKGTGVNQEEILNGTIIDKSIEYYLYQDKNLIKTYQYYDIYYQYMVKELDFAEFYNKAHKVLTHAQNNNNYNNYQNDFEPNIFYGRTNKITFKLCHDYCNTCY